MYGLYTNFYLKVYAHHFKVSVAIHKKTSIIVFAMLCIIY